MKRSLINIVVFAVTSFLVTSQVCAQFGKAATDGVGSARSLTDININKINGAGWAAEIKINGAGWKAAEMRAP